MAAYNGMTQPIIIIGAARSGTKYLRDILALAPNARKVPYDINYIWRFGMEKHPDDALPAQLITADKIAFIRANIHRLAKTGQKEDIRLLEKTVGNTLRVPVVEAVFPNALYIHLIRDGRAVTESAMRMWQEPPNWRKLFEKLRGIPLRNISYAFWFFGNFITGIFAGRGGGKIWGPRYPGLTEDVASERDLTEICARQWTISVDTALKDLAEIPQDRQISIRYDELVSGTDKLTEICDFCGLTNQAEIVSAHQKRVMGGTDDKWRTALSADQQEKIYAIARPTLNQLGYREAGS